MKTDNKVQIIVKNGIIAEVRCNIKDCQIETRDYDIDGSEAYLYEDADRECYTRQILGSDGDCLSEDPLLDDQSID